MKNSHVRIVKVGGSLFDLPDLAGRLRSWLANQSPATSVLLAGGGQRVNELRQEFAVHPQAEEKAHWRAIALLEETATLLRQKLPEFPLIGSAVWNKQEFVDLMNANASTVVFSPTAWLRRVEPNFPGAKLPKTWQTTSDAIAARLAIALSADELVLLKSTLPTEPGPLADYAQQGFIDPVLAELRRQLPATRIVNCRA